MATPIPENRAPFTLDEICSATSGTRRGPSGERSIAGVTTASPQVVQSSAGIGTPHARWREMHQSGREVTML